MFDGVLPYDMAVQSLLITQEFLNLPSLKEVNMAYRADVPWDKIEAHAALMYFLQLLYSCL